MGKLFLKEMYCRYCGCKEADYFTGYYDPLNGKKVLATRCMNISCRIGCRNNGGHKFKSIFSLKCMRCGAKKYICF
jgi:hypothetical protein